MLALALAATFGLASVLQGYATAPLRMAPVANEPNNGPAVPAGKPSGEPGRSAPTRRA